MGRMHTHRHGKSHSIRPAVLRAPSWITQSPAEIEELVVKYSKDGLTPSQIGIKLRDQHSIPLIKSITKKSMDQILEENDLKADNRNVRSLELIEAKVHRLSVYYKRIGRIDKTWKYKSVVAQLE